MDELKGYYSKYRLFLYPVLSLVASILIVVLVVIPQTFSFLNTNKQMDEILGKSEVLAQKFNKLKSTDQSSTEKNVGTVLTILPVEGDVPESVSLLEGLIARSGLALKGISYSGTSKDGSQNFFRLSATFVGPVEQVRVLLLNLKLAPRVFQVESLSAVYRRTDLQLETEIVVKVMQKAIDPEMGGVDKSLPELTEKEAVLLADLTKLVAAKALLSSGRQSSGSAAAVRIQLGKSDPFN